MYQALATWFSHPPLLWLLVAAPLLGACFAYASWQRRRAVAALGSHAALRRLLVLRHGWRRGRAVCVLAGVTLLALAAAGPHWGLDYSQGRAAAGDLVVVLDLSRSMQAEQPSRLERAVRLLRQLADTLQQHGGRRVALVVFAAEPRLLFPLTQDYDHFRHCLRQIETDEVPPLVPGPEVPFASGTRLGAALQLAVTAADVGHGSQPTLLLLSDGDDPAAADEEWLHGVQAARRLGIRIHTVGIGNPDQAEPIPVGGDVLHYHGAVVRTRLNEPLLEEIARRTGGVYLPAHTHALPLGTLVINLLAEPPPLEGTAPDDTLPVYTQQYAWFLGPALLLFLLSLVCRDGRRPAGAGRAP